MEHLKAATAEVETGEAAGSFVALVSTFGPGPDRQGDRVMPGAFARTLERWQQSRQMIPLLTDHAGQVAHVVGRIDPRLSRESSEGLEVSGVIDTSTEDGERAYQLVKAGALSWSIGFVVPEGGRRRRGKVTEIVEIDLAEVSLTPVPADRGARTLSVKSAAATEALTEKQAEILQEIRQGYEAEKAEAEAKEDTYNPYANWVPPRPTDPDSVIAIAGLRVKFRNITVNGR